MSEQTRFRLVPHLSAVLIEARSNVGPIAFGTTSIDGYVEAEVDEVTGGIVGGSSPSARLSVELGGLRSGNALYDAELLRRIDARQYPTSVIELCEAVRLGASDRHRVTGELSFHGVTRRATGTVAVSSADDGSMQIVGEHVFDIRDLDVPAPKVLMLRIYPDVRVQVQLTAQVSRDPIERAEKNEREVGASWEC